MRVPRSNQSQERFIRYALGFLTVGGLVTLLVGVAALPVPIDTSDVAAGSTTLRSVFASTFEEPALSSHNHAVSVATSEEPEGAVATSTLSPSTTTLSTTTPTTATPVSTTLAPSGPVHMVVAEDTMIMGESLVLRPGDSIEFRNHARLMFHTGASADWQGTPTSTWSDNGLVQNLERDIKIFGSGDIMFMDGSLPSVIRFVEIDLQPKPELGHYPLHWHFVGDGSRGTLVEGVVVKNSTMRAFVPHASHGITFRDTIASNIAGEAYWWDPPPSSDREWNQSNNSNNILYEHVLADGVTNTPGDNRGFRLAPITLGAGVGNVIRNSVARNINPTNVKSCAGFQWPEISNHQPGAWVFQNNATFESACNGIFVWQNSGESHLVDGFISSEGIEHGAYTNSYEYRNIQVPYVVAHAVGWSVTSGIIGEIRVLKHGSSGPITFSNVSVGSLRIMNASNDGSQPGYYSFNNTGLACASVAWESWVAGTTVTIDGLSCPPPS